MLLLQRAVRDGPLAQGEILSNLVWYRIDAPAIADQEAEAAQIRYDHVVVMTQMCDLQHDFKARFNDREYVTDEYRQRPLKHLLEGVLLCKAQKEADFRDTDRGVNRRVFEFAQKNQSDRYHCLGPLLEPGANEGQAYQLFVDFKRFWVCPPESVYAAIHANPDAHRIGIVPPPAQRQLFLSSATIGSFLF
jgi:hypothetical protein